MQQDGKNSNHAVVMTIVLNSLNLLWKWKDPDAEKIPAAWKLAKASKLLLAVWLLAVKEQTPPNS